MAVLSSEIQSLGEIQYKSKVKVLLLILLCLVLFILSFLSFYPVGDKIKSIIKTGLNGRGCNPDFDEIHMEWLMPKIIVSNLVIPANCLERAGAPLKFNHLTINYNLINFAPFGLPFKVETEFQGQPLSIYYVAGIGSQMIRIKDQTLSLTRIQPLLGENFKLSGNVTIDMTLNMSKNSMSGFNLKAQSKDLQIPTQNIQGFTTPPMKLNDFYLEAISDSGSRVDVEKLIMGDTSSPMRANFKGKINLQEGNISMSPIDLQGEIAFTESFRSTLPLIDMLFQSFNQKDGFYQIRLGGTLGSPKPIAP
jgi:type II secretion system protein N